MNSLTLAAYGALLLGAIALGGTVVRLLRQISAEKRLAEKVASDPAFRTVSSRINAVQDTKKDTARLALETDQEFQAQMAAILERDADELSPKERRVVGFGLHQSSGAGRASYVTKMALQSRHQLGGAGCRH